MTAGRRRVTVRVPGKVNPQFAVGGLREDGFHEVAHVCLAVSLYDEVTVTLADRPRVSVRGPAFAGVPADESNLAVAAARLLGRRYGVEPDLDIDIVKRIPVAGGMAGGSADAAGTLVAGNALWGLGLSRECLADLGAELGSDVPFSVLGGAALGTGRGERMTPLRSGRVFHFVLVAAGTGLSTPAVFAAQDRMRERAGRPVAAVDRGRPGVAPAVIEALASGDVTTFGAALHNEFEPVATRLLPALAGTREAGRWAGAVAGVLCGTGATYAFLAATAGDARRIASRLRALGTFAAVHTAHGPVPGPVAVPGRVTEPALAEVGG